MSSRPIASTVRSPILRIRSAHISYNASPSGESETYEILRSFSLGLLTMYFLSAFFAKAELIFYFLTALFVCIAMITGKIFVRYPKHFLHIKATENELQLAYYKDKKSTHTFAYSEIEEIRFADKSYTAVCIKREGRKPILFELNKDTPEQGFFLFTIQKILPAVCKTNSKAIAKEFGNEDDYYNRIYEGNN